MPVKTVSALPVIGIIDDKVTAAQLDGNIFALSAVAVETRRDGRRTRAGAARHGFAAAALPHAHF